METFCAKKLKAEDMTDSVTSLTDVICKASGFLDFAESVVALEGLVATNKAIRQAIHRYVTSTSLLNHQHLQLLVAREWPAIEVLQLSSLQLDTQAASVLAQGKWPLLRELHVNDSNLDESGLQALVGDDWPLLEVVDLSNNPLCGSFWWHSNNRWTALKHLYLHHITQGHQTHAAAHNSNMRKPDYMRRSDMAGVVDCKFPRLQTLSMKGSRLDSLDIAALAKGKWPALQKLILGSLSTTAISLQTLYPRWQSLQRLELECGQRTEHIMCQAACADWPVLGELTIRNNELSPEANSAGFTVNMGQCHWALLKSLTLTGFSLNAVAVAYLARGRWPLLQKLRLDHDSLDAACMGQLIYAKWPKVHTLNLKHNRLDWVAVTIMFRGVWPELKSLNLRHNHGHMKLTYHEASSVLLTTPSAWPCLQQLKCCLAGQAFGACTLKRQANDGELCPVLPSRSG